MKVKAYVHLKDLEDSIRRNLSHIDIRLTLDRDINPIWAKEFAEVLVDLEKLIPINSNSYKYRRSSQRHVDKR
jgi:hypothetical protein